MASSNAYQFVTLKEKDVPGAQLIYPEVENHSNVQLKRWLLCRGLTTTGNKSISVASSTDLPNHFNEGHIHHYIIESVQFVGQKQTSKEEDECDIEDLHTSKSLQKGRQYFKSGHDCKTENFYFLKSTVMASYRIDTFIM
ncbi:uncharacterized protein LOC127720860 [Mytilus californianus]|uniref:uncharacterized protein LOC127720860 n=1 Tax=Mytilus californianus TaxID=6549 RepID=UPI002246F591|nr:uncharacterized protein LOC127720860 [Mytilus californianus]